MIKPYDYQEYLIKTLGRTFARGLRKVLACLPTGGGKTIIFSFITKRFLDKNPNAAAMILVHRTELLRQTRKTLFQAFEIEATSIKAGMRYIPKASVYVGMIESVTRRMSKIDSEKIKLIIIDECHIASFNKIHAHFPNALIIGFSATPLSSNKKNPVNSYYEDIVCGPGIPELIQLGFLAQNMTWAPKETVDRLALAQHMKGDDFDDRYMGEVFSKPKYIKNTVDAYKKWGEGVKTLIFNVNVEHSKEVNNAFIEAGYNSKHVDGNTPKVERERIFDWFKKTKNAILNNVGITTVGFDEPSVEKIIVNKATTSMPLWIQMCGRGSRVTDWKSAFTIIDMGGNAITHGDWSQERDWVYIFNNPKNPNGEDGIAPVKSCPECEAIIPAGAKVCPFCGFTFSSKEIPIEIELRDYVMVTKGIDVEKIIHNNAHRKDYYPFFEIGRLLAAEFKNNSKGVTDDFANFILQIYYDKGREWLKTFNKEKGLRKKFNQWHQLTAKNFLFTELKKHFPEWQPTNS